MHKKGIIILLNALIIINILAIGKVKAYEEKLTSNEASLEQEENTQKEQSTESQEISEYENISTNDENTRTFEGKINIYNSQFGTVEGVDNGEVIKYKSYFLNTSTSWETTSGTLDESNLAKIKNIKIIPKSGYEWSCELKDFTWEEQGVLDIDKTISLKNGDIRKKDVKYSDENTMFIKPITYNKWSEFQPKDIYGEINITFNPKKDAEKITLDVNENGKIEHDLYNLHFENNSAFIDKDSNHTFTLNPNKGYKVGSVTLDNNPVKLNGNKITVGAGTLKVKFVKDNSVLETKNLNIEVNKSENNTFSENKNFEYDSREEVTIEIEDLGNIENIDTIKRVYNNKNQEVNYNIVDKDGNIITSGKATFIKKVLGIPIEVDAKKNGKYKLKIKFEGNENYKPLEIEKEFEITKLKSNSKVENKNLQSSDIKGHWAEETIKLFVKKGYITGYDNKTFKPDGEITRAEFVKLVNQVYNFKTKGNIEFKDVKKGQWFYDDIAIAVNEGYINGRSKDIFAPNDKITREEAMTILTNISNNKDNNLDKLKQFKDGKNVSDWAKSSVEGAIEAGYLNGYADKNIRPKSKMTRAEAISLLSKTI